MRFTIITALSIFLTLAFGIAIAASPPGHPSNPKLESAYNVASSLLPEQVTSFNEEELRRVEAARPPAPPSHLRIQGAQNQQERSDEDRSDNTKEVHP